MPEGKGQADAAHAQAGGGVQRRKEEAHGLARAHGEREGAGRGQQHQPPQAGAGFKVRHGLLPRRPAAPGIRR